MRRQEEMEEIYSSLFYSSLLPNSFCTIRERSQAIYQGAQHD
jgi:hypothetical protein